MSWGFRKRFTLGPFVLNLSKRGVSVTAKAGPVSTNSRTRRPRISLPFGTWCGSQGGSND